MERSSRPLLAAVLGAILVLLCLAVRIPWSTTPGYIGDMRSFHAWAAAGSNLRSRAVDGVSAGRVGIGKLYRAKPDCNYPPFYVEVLSFLPGLHSWWYGEPSWRGRVRGVGRQLIRRPLHWSIARVLKLPAIIASAAIVVLVFGWAWRMTSPARAFLIGAFWALNPFDIFNGSYFGQVDAFLGFWMLAALLAVAERRIVWAWPLLTLALLTKPQAVVLVPIIALETLRPLVTALRRTDHAAAVAALRTWLAAAVASTAVACVVLWPFVRTGTLGDVGKVYTGSISATINAHTTVTAHNLWWLMIEPPVQRAMLPRDDEPIGGIVTPRQIGFLLFGATLIGALSLCALGDSRRTTILAAAVIVFAFFLFSTQMKARYCFPVVVLLLPMIAFDRRYGLVEAVLTLTFLINGVRVLNLDATLASFVPALNAFANAMWTGHVVASINLIVFAWLCLDLYRGAARRRRPVIA